jgi:hypothetical protein
MTFDPMKPLGDLEQIVAQVEAAKDVDRESRALSKVWKQISDKFQEAIDGATLNEGTYAKAGDVPGLLDGAKAAKAIADALNPTAEMTWTADSLDDLLVSVRFFRLNGAYTDDALTNANTVIEKAALLGKARGKTTGAGTPGTRTPGTPIPGRPAKVRVDSLLGDEPTRITQQTGNLDNSPGNLQKQVVQWLQGVSPDPITGEQKTAIGSAISKVVRDGAETADIGDFARVYVVHD